MELGGGSVGVRLGIGVGDVAILLGDGDGRRGGSGDGGWRKPPGPWRSARSAPLLGLGCVRRSLESWARGSCLCGGGRLVECGSGKREGVR